MKLLIIVIATLFLKVSVFAETSAKESVDLSDDEAIPHERKSHKSGRLRLARLKAESEARAKAAAKEGRVVSADEEVAAIAASDAAAFAEADAAAKKKHQLLSKPPQVK